MKERGLVVFWLVGFSSVLPAPFSTPSLFLIPDALVLGVENQHLYSVVGVLGADDFRGLFAEVFRLAIFFRSRECF
jgi:hypothetical protein